MRNNTTCETRGAFEHANPRCGAAIYVVLVVHVRLMYTRYAAAVRGSCQDIWSSLPMLSLAPSARLNKASAGFLVLAARLRENHIIREEGASDTSEIACVARLCTRTEVLEGDAMADGACLIAQEAGRYGGAKISKLVLSAPSTSSTSSCLVQSSCQEQLGRVSLDCTYTPGADWVMRTIS